MELYDQFQLALPDSERIKVRLSSLLQMVSERANAISTHLIKETQVILSGEPTKEFMRYYLQQANAHLKYDKISEVELDSSVQGKEQGDQVTSQFV